MDHLPYEGSYSLQWEVLWVKNKRVIRHNFGNDLVEAVRIKGLAEKAGRKHVTLRCKNRGFPPPVELRPRVVEMKERLPTPRIVRMHGKRYRQTHTRVKAMYVPLKKHNAEGRFWCPYCMELRPFKFKDSFVIEDVRVHERRFVCAMCGISHRDVHVRRWNPQIPKIAESLEQQRRRAPARTAKTRKQAYRRKRRRKR